MQPDKIMCRYCGSTAWQDERVETTYRCQDCGHSMTFELPERTGGYD
jgi:DNA-directed RNA polymerase subunit RPC12/RpoP